ncbi:hypothetical protein [Pantoea sp. ME81]|uniref:gp53-like domain-containing protein n=1 Tax=Pantoea sp. ME81 TaxID=2743935 RepID=UPI0015F6ABE2|nr:hypothetical protein [Pantoea sp. ME81]
MDRKIVYPGQIPLETDLLLTNKFAMIGIARLAEAILGSSTFLYGLECQPCRHKSLSVHISEGQIYSLEDIDRTSFSTLGADTDSKILKQGFAKAQDIELAPPKAPGHSICYLLQVKYFDEDTGEMVLPYYNAANPAAGYSGPGNSGKAQRTVRAGRCIMDLKPGGSAPTGTQKMPDADADYYPAWIITVKHGATSLSERDISMHPGAPFMPKDGLITALQHAHFTIGTDRGSANTYAVTFQPAIKSLKDGMRLYFRATNANTESCSLTVDRHPSHAIVTSEGQTLQAGSIIKGSIVEVIWNESQSSWVIDQAGCSGGELRKNFLSLKGGVIDGKLAITEELTVGNCKLCSDGNIEGERWRKKGTEKNDLFSWVKGQAKISGNESAWIYYEKNSGLIIQGGLAERNNQETIVKFPVKFPMCCLSVQIAFHGDSPKSSWNGIISYVTARQFKILLGNDEKKFYWHAIGF